MEKKRKKWLEMKKFAEEKHNGKCLSEDYTRNDRRYDWKCDNPKHPIFQLGWDNVKRGRWCKQCANDKLRKPFIEIEEKIKEFGGTLISTEDEYINNKSKIKYLCDEGHLCNRTWDVIQRARLNISGKKTSWCATCSKKEKPSMSEIRQIAASKNGQLISNSYKNKSQKLTWICANGHEFTMTLGNVKSGQWCPKCSSRFSESLTRFYLENILSMELVKSYPNWLKPLELDGYNANHKVAFEYQGIQHREYDPKFFHKDGKHKFEEQKQRDLIKQRKCREKNIRLIEIDDRIEEKELFSFLLKKCVELGLKIKNKNKPDLVDFYKKFYKNKLTEILEIVEKKNGKCYIKTSRGKKLQFSCDKGHLFSKTPNDILKGSWCNTCSGRTKVSAEQKAKEHIQNHGGEMLTEYVNRVSPIRWKCSHGHENQTTWASLQKSREKGTSGCSTCSGNKKGSIEEMHKIARQRNGKCISRQYNGASTKLEWECQNEHRWFATPQNVKNKSSWCPHCFDESRKKSDARK